MGSRRILSKVCVCKNCNKEFNPWAQTPDQIFCCSECRSEFKHKESVKNSVKNCYYCDEVFIRKIGSKTKYCPECIKAGRCYDACRKYHRNSLDSDAMKARKAGMSYGMWRASQWSHFRPSEPKSLVNQTRKEN